MTELESLSIDDVDLAVAALDAWHAAERRAMKRSQKGGRE